MSPQEEPLEKYWQSLPKGFIIPTTEFEYNGLTSTFEDGRIELKGVPDEPT
jgi:hypothetical protein